MTERGLYTRQLFLIHNIHTRSLTKQCQQDLPTLFSTFRRHIGHSQDKSPALSELRLRNEQFPCCYTA